MTLERLIWYRREISHRRMINCATWPSIDLEELKELIDQAIEREQAKQKPGSRA